MVCLAKPLLCDSQESHTRDIDGYPRIPTGSGHEEIPRTGNGAKIMAWYEYIMNKEAMFMRF